MKVRLLRVTEDGVNLLREAAGITSPQRISVRTLVENDYSSVLEHIVFTFELRDISIAISRELLEHRIASHTARSTRFQDEGNFGFYQPEMSEHASQIYKEAIEKCREAYKKIAAIEGKEKARYVLPLATYTHYIWTVNARSLINFLSLRLCVRAAPEMRDLAQRVLKICREKYPEIFAGIYCRGVTFGACPENDARPEECPFKNLIRTKKELKSEIAREDLENIIKRVEERVPAHVGIHRPT